MGGYPHAPCICEMIVVVIIYAQPLTGSRGVLCVLGLGCILFTSVVFQFVKYLSAATLIPKSDLLSQKHTGTFLFRLNYGGGGEESSL